VEKTWTEATQFHTTMICTSNTFLSFCRNCFRFFCVRTAQINTQIWISIGDPHCGDEGRLYPGNASDTQEGSSAGSADAWHSGYLGHMGAHGSKVRIG